MTDPVEHMVIAGENSDAGSNGMPPKIVAAIRSLDPDGGWDHETIGGWPSMQLWRDLRDAESLGFVERSSAYGVECWRLTEEGIQMRSEMHP